MRHLLAQQVADAEEPYVWVNFLVAWGPVLMIAGLIFWGIRSHNRRAKAHMERLARHMDAVERTAGVG